MTVTVLPTLSTGSGSPQQLSATSILARWVTIVPSINMYFGDSTISSAGAGTGILLQATIPFTLPEACDRYDLSALYVLFGSGHCQVIYGT